ncbi:AAA family ATPase [Emticicia fontis]
MVKEVNIQNFKSIQDLTLKLGRVNVIIGANGSGKSNILEAIAMGVAGLEGKLSNEFLTSRGIRVTESQWMYSGFKSEIKKKEISIVFKLQTDDTFPIKLIIDDKPFSDWRVLEETSFPGVYKHKIKKAIEPWVIEKFDLNIDNQVNEIELSLKDEIISELSKVSGSNAEDLVIRAFDDEMRRSIANRLRESILEGTTEEYYQKFISENIEVFADFLIYAPENSSLRKFEDESQIEPLGIKGEGLFKLITIMSSETPEEFEELVANMEIIDWFEKFEIPKDLKFNDRKIRIKDRYLDEDLKYFDQRSSNEGFLYLLFYFALFTSKFTPKFFAIDNIDVALNPKLCSELIKILTRLAKKYDKQVIFTTHNPAILDGLNLNDEEQRLFVANRNIEGETTIKRIKKKTTAETKDPVKLSEQFLRGYLGGLPNNF